MHCLICQQECSGRLVMYQTYQLGLDVLLRAPERHVVLAGSRKKLANNGGERCLTTAASTLYHGTSQRPLQARHSGFMAQQRQDVAAPGTTGGLSSHLAGPAGAAAEGTPGADPTLVTSAAERILQGGAGGVDDQGRAQRQPGAEAGASGHVPGEEGMHDRGASKAHCLDRPPLGRQSAGGGSLHSSGRRRVIVRPSPAASDDTTKVGLKPISHNVQTPVLLYGGKVCPVSMKPSWC